MTVRLVKQKQKANNEQKPVSEPSINQLMVTTRNWVEEFKARKAKPSESLGLLIRSN